MDASEQLLSLKDSESIERKASPSKWSKKEIL